MTIAERVAARHLSASIEDPWLTQQDVAALCPPCADKMASLNIREIRASAFFGQDAMKLAGEKQAKKWQKLPKGWTDESLKKFWASITGDTKHKVTACIKKMTGKLDDPGAFCASAKDRIEGTTKWRGQEE